MKKYYVFAIISAAALGACAVTAGVFKNYTNKNHRFIPAAELQIR